VPVIDWDDLWNTTEVTHMIEAEGIQPEPTITRGDTS